MSLVPRILVLSDLAKTEHDAIVEIPLTVGIRPTRVEPPPAVRNPPDREDVRTAVGIGDPLHRDPEDFAVGLILVLVADVRAGFGGEQFNDMAVEAFRVLLAPFPQAGGIEQFGRGRVVGVAEVGRGEDDRINRLFLVERREGAIVHQALGVAADREASFDALEELLLGDTADQEGAPLGETGLDDQNRRFRHLAFDHRLECGHHVVEVGIGAGLHATEQVVLTNGKLTQLTVGDKSLGIHNIPRRDSTLPFKLAHIRVRHSRRRPILSRVLLWRIRKVLSKNFVWLQ